MTAVPLLPVLACFLGGATEKWAEGIVVALLGLLLLAAAAAVFARATDRTSSSLALLACAATAFLPAHWFFQPGLARRRS
ncbi:MAG: hypothetical protein WKF47_06375 [Geodermatophilaceae bacterium]